MALEGLRDIIREVTAFFTRACFQNELRDIFPTVCPQKRTNLPSSRFLNSSGEIADIYGEKAVFSGHRFSRLAKKPWFPANILIYWFFYFCLAKSPAILGAFFLKKIVMFFEAADLFS